MVSEGRGYLNVGQAEGEKSKCDRKKKNKINKKEWKGKEGATMSGNQAVGKNWGLGRQKGLGPPMEQRGVLLPQREAGYFSISVLNPILSLHWLEITDKESWEHNLPLTELDRLSNGYRYLQAIIRHLNLGLFHCK